MTHKPILLMQTGDTPPFIMQRVGNFDGMFYRIGGLEPEFTRTVHVQRGEEPCSPTSYSAVIVTGSHYMVTDRPPWSVNAEKWLRRAFIEGVPIFAVCYGHQLLAQALGGKVDYLDNGEELGTLPVNLTQPGTNDPFLAGLPTRFLANLAHSQTVTTCPRDALVLASSERDPHQILRYGPHSFSVQFHPEFDKVVCEACIEYYRQMHPERSTYYDGLLQQAAETPVAAGLLVKFIEEATGRKPS